MSEVAADGNQSATGNQIVKSFKKSCDKGFDLGCTSTSDIFPGKMQKNATAFCSPVARSGIRNIFDSNS